MIAPEVPITRGSNSPPFSWTRSGYQKKAEEPAAEKKRKEQQSRETAAASPVCCGVYTIIYK